MELQTLSSFFTLAHFFVLQLAQVAVAWTHIPGNTGHILVWFDNELYNPHSHGLDGKKLAIFQFDNPGNLQIWTDGTLAILPTDNCGKPNVTSPPLSLRNCLDTDTGSSEKVRSSFS